MTARAATLLLDHDGEPQFARWTFAGALVLAAHVGLMASYLLLRPAEPPGAPAAPVVIVELAPLPVAPASQFDVTPGPEMQAAPPEPKVERPPEPLVIEVPPPPPIVQPPVVMAPEPPPPEVKRVEREPPAPQTTAPPRSERNTAARPAAPAPGAVSQSALADWRSRVVSQLQRAKRYPGGAASRREQGTVTLAFTLSRSGSVLARHIVRGSGHSELDQEVLAMVQRAAPFPPFPAGMNQPSVQLSVPVNFALR
jgi:protein TonB